MGRPVLAGFEFDFSTPMNPVTTGNASNFRLGKYVTRRVRRKVVKVLQPVRFTERFNPSNNSVKLLADRQADVPEGGPDHTGRHASGRDQQRRGRSPGRRQ